MSRRSKRIGLRANMDISSGVDAYLTLNGLYAKKKDLCFFLNMMACMCASLKVI